MDFEHGRPRGQFSVILAAAHRTVEHAQADAVRSNSNLCLQVNPTRGLSLTSPAHARPAAKVEAIDPIANDLEVQVPTAHRGRWQANVVTLGATDERERPVKEDFGRSVVVRPANSNSNGCG